MPDIGEFAQLAADRFLDSQRDIKDQFNLSLPRQAVEEFVRTVYYASLIPDEGRYPSVCLMSYRKGADRSLHFLFNSPIRPSAQEISKLAHATAPGSHICCICDKGEIALGGIHITMLNEMREFGYSSSRVANPLKLLIRGPGHIEMSSGRYRPSLQGRRDYRGKPVSIQPVDENASQRDCTGAAGAYYRDC